MSDSITIRYTFTHNGHVRVYDVELDANTLAHRFTPPATPQAWTKLEFEQCKGCPLNAAEHPHCPLALSLEHLVKSCGPLLSFEELEARVDTPDRTIIKRTTAQKALSSLLGLQMATSGCPNMQFLRPMARFHTAFASRQETMYRSASTYLLGQYFLWHQGKRADLDLAGLERAYSKIHAVNVGIARRMRSIAQGDANLNALVLLDLFAQQMPSAISERLNEIEYLFASYFED